ncbi:hypothetical protein C8Q80DRAFT_1268313 [Daedaleopsis nitida]|nr:hypothetical protein C8Q80DRAFT_1268313 [Daedaleopsis nitida]
MQGRRSVRVRSDTAPKPVPSDHRAARAPSKSSKRSSNRPTDHTRGGAKSATLHNEPSTCTRAASSSRHIRHGQPRTQTRRTAADDRPSAPRDVLPRHARAASSPPPSPAKDLLRRARATAEAETDWLGRRPFIMDLVLANRSAGLQQSRAPSQQQQQQHSDPEDDGVLEAIELCAAALRPVRGVYPIADARSLEIYWEAQAARSLLGAGGESQHVPVPAHQVSAERSTVSWAGDD